ncbi:hypothetical protein [Dyella sp. ASV21]|uniref:hypothetical protein n=1 Tax=Dyella sp. ASV21 TaxID=2795114 RepID=UPI0018EC398A|nr:hypothetical protein [Dyella sp. ASV21]
MRVHKARSVGKTEVGAAAEAITLRLALTLSRDVSRNPQACAAHSAYINGAIGMALSLGLLSEDRAMQLRKACGQMMTGATLPPSDVPTIDPAYARIIVAVRRNAGATLTSPIEMADLGTTGARAVLARLQQDGIVGEPDMLGFYPLRAGEV